MRDYWNTPREECTSTVFPLDVFVTSAGIHIADEKEPNAEK